MLSEVIHPDIPDPKRPKALGTHYIIDFFECSSIPSKVETLQAEMENAARLAKVTIIKSVFHAYNPYGISGVVVIAESHFAIHTWPEYQVASLDLFSCGEINPEEAIHYLEDILGAKDMRITILDRGI